MEFAEAREASYVVNRKLRNERGAEEGFEIHEIVHFKFGERPTERSNKIVFPIKVNSQANFSAI